MRQSKTVKIQLDVPGSDEILEKEFTVKELSIRSIIELSQNNSFFSDSKPKDPDPAQDIKKEENGQEPDVTAAVADQGPGVTLFEELSGMGDDIGKVMKETCDFEISEMIDLYPSEVKELYQAFQEVNQTFLDVLRKLKILDMFLGIMERAFTNFSGMLAI